MADVFTPEISYGPWSVGMMQPDLPGLGYRTVQSAAPDNGVSITFDTASITFDNTSYTFDKAA